MAGVLSIVIRGGGALSPFPRAAGLVLLIMAGLIVSGLCSAEAGRLPPQHAPGRILIKPKAHVSSAGLTNLHKTRGARVLQTFRSGVQVVALPHGQQVADAVKAYKESGLVEYAEPDHIVRAAASPNDPFFLEGIQWSLINTGQNNGVPGADIRAEPAWDVASSASNIVVAILDTGVRYTHEDLLPNLWVNTNDNSYGFNAFTGMNDPLDDQGHGTQVAGIMGAVGDNGLGICGVAWRLQMMAVKCLNEAGEGTDSSVIAALEFAQTNGARIINTSFSGNEFSESVSNALENVRAAGIIVVAPAGNEWSDVDAMPRYPACYPLDNIVSVGYTDNEDILGITSNFGVTNVDLMAPGAPMFSTCFEADNAYGPTNFPAESLSGTSFAAAHVSAALALILEKFPNEDYATSLRRLFLAVDKLPQLEGTCATAGRLNLVNAFNPPIQLSLLTVTSESLELQAATSPNRPLVIESSPDLLTWTPVFTNSTSTFGTFTFTDTAVTNAPQQFYRATAVP